MNKSLYLLRKNIKDLLDLKEMTQRDLAKKTGQSPTSLNRLFTTETDFRISILDRFGKALNMEPYQFLLPTVPKETPTITGLLKTIEKQAVMLDGNEELLEAWNQLDEIQKEILLNQIKMQVPQNEKNKKFKA